MITDIKIAKRDMRKLKMRNLPRSGILSDGGKIAEIINRNTISDTRTLMVRPILVEPAGNANTKILRNEIRMHGTIKLTM